MAPVNGCAPVSGDQYIAPFSKVTYRDPLAPKVSGEVGPPSGLAIPPMASQRAWIAPPRRVSARSSGPGGSLNRAAMSRMRSISAYAALPGHSVLPTSRWANTAGRVGEAPSGTVVADPPADGSTAVPNGSTP